MLNKPATTRTASSTLTAVESRGRDQAIEMKPPGGNDRVGGTSARWRSPVKNGSIAPRAVILGSAIKPPGSQS
jgi:hypothetical protein